MPYRFDQASIESSPEQHDSEAIPPGSTEEDCAAISALIDACHAPDGPILDIACGSGRHVRAFQALRDAFGCDIDERMISEAQSADPEHANHYQCCDASALTDSERYAVITLLNHSLVCFHSHRQAFGLFQSVAQALRPGGLFIIDNCCSVLWQQVKEGLFADGLSDDEQEQLIFLPGENRFTWRKGEAVEPDNWEISENDRLYRLWSLNEIALAAAGAGLATVQLDNDKQFLVLSRPEV